MKRYLNFRESLRGEEVLKDRARVRAHGSEADIEDHSALSLCYTGNVLQTKHTDRYLLILQ